MRTRTNRTRSAALAAALLACSGGDAGGGGDPTPRAPSWGLVEETEFGATLSAGAREACDVDLTVDDLGRLLIVYPDVMAYGAIRTHRWTSPSWTELGNFPDQPAGPGVAATRTAAGEPVRVWFDQDTDDVRAARWTGTAWEDLGAPIPTEVGYFVRAAEGPGGPAIAWTDYSITYLAHAGRVARWEGTGWVELGTPRLVSATTSYDDLHLAIAVQPDGNPVLAYTAGGAARIERWDGAGSSWVALPDLPAPPSSPVNVQVAVDGAGAVYATASYLSTQLQIDGVYRLAPGAAAWTSLGLPPGNVLARSMVAVRGLAGEGVFAGWTGAAYYGSGGGAPDLARWTPAGWEDVARTTFADWTWEARPMIRPVSDTDVWLGFTDGVTFHGTRWRLLP